MQTHGSDCVEDMIIPFFFYGKQFGCGEIKEGVSLLEIAPTIAKVMGITPDSEWEGRAII